MTQHTVLLISTNNEMYEALRFACLYLPVRIIHTREAQMGMVLAHTLKPSMIFIDANDELAHTGWVLARMIRHDDQLRGIPVSMISSARNAQALAEKIGVKCSLPRTLPIVPTRSLVQQQLNVFPIEQTSMVFEHPI